MPEPTTGMVLGKFMPPHLGHQYLVDFARNYCDRLTVLVCSLDTEPIPGELRFEWMRRMFPDCEVVWVRDDLPQQPADVVDFWERWRAAIRARLPRGPDYVFASEEYGARLAAELGAAFVPVDIARELVGTSGTDVRADALANWAFLPAEVRPYFVRRVCVFGPESTGKTWLARRLAERFDTVWVHEYARGLLDRKGGVCDFEDIARIARGQCAAEDALARQANRVLFCDTDALTTTLWSAELFGRVDDDLVALARTRQYDLTLLCDVDVPFVADVQRYFPDEASRRGFMERCRAALEAHEREVVVIRGDWAAREAAAVSAVEALLRRR